MAVAWEVGINKSCKNPLGNFLTRKGPGLRNSGSVGLSKALNFAFYLLNISLSGCTRLQMQHHFRCITASILWDILWCCRDALTVMCGLSCPMACRILVPRTGIKPTVLALQGRFLTTGPPGKSLHFEKHLWGFCPKWVTGYMWRNTDLEGGFYMKNNYKSI